MHPEEFYNIVIQQAEKRPPILPLAMFYDHAKPALYDDITVTLLRNFKFACSDISDYRKQLIAFKEQTEQKSPYLQQAFWYIDMYFKKLVVDYNLPDRYVPDLYIVQETEDPSLGDTAPRWIERIFSKMQITLVYQNKAFSFPVATHCKYCVAPKKPDGLIGRIELTVSREFAAWYWLCHKSALAQQQNPTSQQPITHEFFRFCKYQKLFGPLEQHIPPVESPTRQFGHIKILEEFQPYGTRAILTRENYPDLDCPNGMKMLYYCNGNFHQVTLLRRIDTSWCLQLDAYGLSAYRMILSEERQRKCWLKPR